MATKKKAPAPKPSSPAPLYKPGDKVFFISFQTGTPFLVQGEIQEHKSITVPVRSEENGRIISTAVYHSYTLTSPLGPQELSETALYRTFAIGSAEFAKRFLKLL